MHCTHAHYTPCILRGQLSDRVFCVICLSREKSWFPPLMVLLVLRGRLPWRMGRLARVSAQGACGPALREEVVTFVCGCVWCFGFGTWNME